MYTLISYPSILVFVSPAKQSGTYIGITLSGVCLCISSVRLSSSHITHSYVLQSTHAFLEMLPLCYIFKSCILFSVMNVNLNKHSGSIGSAVYIMYSLEFTQSYFCTSEI